MTCPRISVVMPLFNKEKEVHRAISSVLAQSIDDFELIVINDGSTDRGPDVVCSFRDRRILLIDQPNAGVSAARNRGIKEARSELIAFLDADDEWVPDFLSSIFELKRECPDTKVFATRYAFRRPDGYERPALIRGLPVNFSRGILEDYFAIAACSDPPLWSSAVAVRRELILSLNGFPEGVTSGEDLLTWARLAVNNDIAYLNDIKAYFWEPFTMADRTERRPQVPDVVSRELTLLLQQVTGERRKSLERYIAFWHKMRATIFLRLRDKRSALNEIKIVSKYSLNGRLFLLMCMLIMPHVVVERAYEFKGK